VVAHSPLATRHSQLEKAEDREARGEEREASSEERERSETRAIIDVLDSEAFLPTDVIRLAAWVAEYYACGVGEALAAAMPPRSWVESGRYARITEMGEGRRLTERGARRSVLDVLTGGKRVRAGLMSVQVLRGLEEDRLIQLDTPLRGSASASRTVRVATVTAQGHDADLRLGPRQREALELLRASPDGLDVSDLNGRGISGGTLKRLAELGLVSLSRRLSERDPFERGAALEADGLRHTLTSEQTLAFERLAALASTGAFHAVLLHGVTGSGKTEVYLRLADVVRRSGRGVLLLVPEISLTPQLAAVVRAWFGGGVAIQHSGLSDGERHDQWQRIRRGDVGVVVGTRSAVFAPIERLGLIVVDEEHDGSYKQEERPRYHGRDVAVMRASQTGALAVLGSATPSMESYQNAETARYEILTLGRRVYDRPLPTVRIVDMREEYAAAGPDVIVSTALGEALEQRIARREQSIVLLNRRGYATAVFCRQCAATLECPNCSVSLTVHKAARRARCHYCNYSQALPKACRQCAGPYLEQMGFGTERVEAEIRARVPASRVARVDRDTMAKRGAISALLAQFAAGDLDVLVGTQMIAKGHDFPRVTLVGVISADVGLGLADFRAGERTFQLLTQVAGRAGRGESPGEAIVQTLYPNHYSIRHACRQDYTAFFADEIGYRRAMRYPPAVALINVIVRARTREAAMDEARDLVAALRGQDAFRVLGPATAPLSRLKGEHRAQFFMKGTHRVVMRKALLAALAERPEVRRRTIVDVDPMSVL
jgi:primosomal protein N' (replication factor Y)